MKGTDAQHPLKIGDKLTGHCRILILTDYYNTMFHKRCQTIVVCGNDRVKWIYAHWYDSRIILTMQRGLIFDIVADLTDEKSSERQWVWLKVREWGEEGKRAGDRNVRMAKKTLLTWTLTNSLALQKSFNNRERARKVEPDGGNMWSRAFKPLSLCLTRLVHVHVARHVLMQKVIERENKGRSLVRERRVKRKREGGGVDKQQCTTETLT